MALNKQSLNINFAQGLDTKTDPKQVQPGKFLSLQNSVFSKTGLLEKRNGYGELTLLQEDAEFITTFNNNLTAVGKTLQAYSQPSNTWVNRGTLQPLQLNTLPLIRSNTNQSHADAVVSPNGLVCTAYTDDVPNALGSTSTYYKYAVADAVTGQNIVPPTVITTTGVCAPKVFYLGNFFVILFGATVSGTPHLRYISISSFNPNLISIATDISTQYSPNTTGNYDAIVANNHLYVAWNGSDVGGAIRMTYFDSILNQGNTIVYSGKKSTLMSLTSDIVNSKIWVTFYDKISNNGYALVVDYLIAPVLAPTSWTSGTALNNVTTLATAGVLTIYYEVSNSYSYDSSIETDYIKTNTMTQGGSLGAASILVRSVGLASKAFYVADAPYFLSVYMSNFQPTYFLLNGLGEVLAKLAYSNGGPPPRTGLPNITVTDNVAQICYLIKDLVQSVNKSQGAANATGIYSQTGINLVSFTLNATETATAEIGNNLLLTGGFLWQYDGYSPVEQNFHLWPDSVEVFSALDRVVTGTVVITSNVVTSVSSFTGLFVGMKISGTGIPANTFIVALNPGASIITMSAAATASGAGISITINGSLTAQQYFYQVTYEWSDNQGNVFRSAPSVPVSITLSAGSGTARIDVPTLRLTYKIANPVKIVIYRWSAAQQVYYQVTSLAVPLLNDLSVDSVEFVDTSSDSAVLGNNIIYTTGGVVENIGPPPCSAVTLFKSRFLLVNAEDPNLLEYSKQVIEATPVEMSDLFTIFVAPTTAAQGNTGPMRALSAMDDKLIIFKKNAMYYITGDGPDNTGANNNFSEPTFISSTVGCTNQHSIVLTPDGIMFQSDKGIWLLGRDLSTQYIGAPVEEFNSSRVQSAVTVPGTNQVRFTLSNGVTLMYDYYFRQWGSFTNVPAISSILYQDLHTYLNSRGKIFQETPGTYLDGANPVLISFTTSWYNLAGVQGFERAYFFSLLGTYLSPHLLQIGIAYDYATTPAAPLQQVIINPDNFGPPWGGDPLWGSSSPWGGPSNLEQWRVFFSTQKCQSFQITFNEIFDGSFGMPAGAGLSLSGINLVAGIKKTWATFKASNSVG